LSDSFSAKFGDATTDWWVTSLCAVANTGKFLQGQVGNLLNTESLASATFGAFDLYDSSNNELTDLGYYRITCDLTFSASEAWWPSGFSTAAANLFWPQTTISTTPIAWQAGEVSGAQTLQMISGHSITSSPAGSDDFCKSSFMNCKPETPYRTPHTAHRTPGNWLKLVQGPPRLAPPLSL
jgi:hypothetical protein